MIKAKNTEVTFHRPLNAEEKVARNGFRGVWNPRAFSKYPPSIDIYALRGELMRELRMRLPKSVLSAKSENIILALEVGAPHFLREKCAQFVGKISEPDERHRFSQIFALDIEFLHEK